MACRFIQAKAVRAARVAGQSGLSGCRCLGQTLVPDIVGMHFD
jgi:hypothetical protein